MSRLTMAVLHGLAAAVFFASFQKFALKSSTDVMAMWAVAGALGAGWLSWKQGGGGA